MKYETVAEANIVVKLSVLKVREILRGNPKSKTNFTAA
jgi:hypothetical protein